MTTKPEEIISGTEAELLEKLKQKYNLIENVSTSTAELSAEPTVTDQLLPANPAIRHAAIGNKATTGFSGLFDGTSWGKQ
jgi:hypothetical protein